MIQCIKKRIYYYYYYLSSVTAPAGEGLYESEDMQSATFTPVHHEAAVEGEGEDLEEEEQDKEEELEQMHTSSAHSMSKVRNWDCESLWSQTEKQAVDFLEAFMQISIICLNQSSQFYMHSYANKHNLLFCSNFTI